MVTGRKFTRLDRFKPPQQLVFAKGATGQKLRISGEDAFTGGVGSRSNDDVFGGEELGGNWSGNTAADGITTVRSKQAILFGNAGDSLIVNSASAQQDVAGDLEFEGLFKLNLSAANGMNARIGLGKVGAGTTTQGEEVSLYRNDTDDIDLWKAITKKNSATTTGDSIVIANNTWFRLKIVLSGSDAKFYVNGTLIATNSTNLPTDELLQPFLLQDSGLVDDALSSKRIKYNFT